MDTASLSSALTEADPGEVLTTLQETVAADPEAGAALQSAGGDLAKVEVLPIPKPQVAAIPVCNNEPGWADEFGQSCRDWAATCGDDALLTADHCEGATKGPDGQKCEAGGTGPDAGGFYYSKQFMDTVREKCISACGLCETEPQPIVTAEDFAAEMA